MKFDGLKTFNGMSGVVSKNEFQIWLPFYQVRENFFVTREVMSRPTINQPTIPQIQRIWNSKSGNKNILRLICNITLIPG